jgi:hypothetical protein
VSDRQNCHPYAAQQQAWEALWRRLLMPRDALVPPEDGQETDPVTETGASESTIDKSESGEGNR